MRTSTLSIRQRKHEKKKAKEETNKQRADNTGQNKMIHN